MRLPFLYQTKLLAVCLIMFLSGCTSTGLLKYSLNTPAITLHPIGQPAVTDGRARFRDILCTLNEDHGVSFPDHRPCDQILHRLNDEPVATISSRPVLQERLKNPTTIVFVPGFLGECIKDVVAPFSDSYAHLKSLGYETKTIQVSGRSSSEYNAQTLKDALTTIPLTHRIIIVAYSKGVPDTLQMLIAFPETAKKIQAVVSIAGVVSGTPLADDFASTYDTFFSKLPHSSCPPGDGGAARSLTRKTRMNWLVNNPLPSSIRFYSLVAFAERSHTSGPLQIFYDQLTPIDPRNDGQVVYYDAVIPGSTLLGYVNADHWAVALPFNRTHSLWNTFVDHNAFPREIVIESVLNFINEQL